FGSVPQTGPEAGAPWPRIALGLAALLLIGISGGLALKYRSWFSGPERSLTYWLSVQRMYDGKPLGQPFDATGRDYFHTGDAFVLNIVPNQPGALYLIDEGRDDKGFPEWNFLFPTNMNNQGQAKLDRLQTVRTGNYRFAGSSG